MILEHMPEKCSFLSYGNLWNIDHEIPCHAVGQCTEETLKTMCFYDNLRPMTKKKTVPNVLAYYLKNNNYFFYYI